MIISSEPEIINILIIEDNENDLYYIKEALSDKRYNLNIIMEGEDAYNYLRSPTIKPDIVLLDNKLPGLNGLEILDRICKEQNDYSFIFLTADTIVEDIAKAMKAGALDFMVKSSDLKNELPEKIEKVYAIHQNKTERIKISKELIKAKEIAKENETRYKLMFASTGTANSLIQSEAYHSSMISNISDVIGIIGVNGLMKYKSPNIEKFFGWKPEELVGTDGWLTVHPNDLSRIQKGFFSILDKDNSAITLEFLYKCKDGSYKPIELTAINLTNDPIIGGVLLNYHDITERKQTEEKLRTSEAKFRAVAELSPMAIYSSSGSDQKAVYINEAFYKIFGFTMEDVPTVGHWWIKAFPDEKYRQQVIDQWTYNIEQADKNKTDVGVLECICTCNDGSEKIIGWVGKTIGDEFWAFGYDFTERKQAELLLQKKNIEIEAQIEEYKKITDELIVAKESAEESDRLKSAFLENISHEVRTPMNAILGYSKLLLKLNLLEEKRNHYTDNLHKATYQLLSVVENTIALAHIETKQLEINKMRFCPTVLLSKLYKEYNSKKHIMEKSHIELILKNSELTSYQISNDYTRINQIFNILLDNAFKFTKIGIIEFGFTNTENKINFYVKDTGIGIPKDKQQVIFKSFTQADKHTQQLFGGLGVGLAIALGLVKILGGDIIINSQVNEGTEIIFSLPIS